MVEIDCTKPLYTLRVASELSGVSKYSIRQYIDKGLIIPYKTETERNLFSHVDIKRLRNIRTDLTEHGLNIAGIKRVMAQTPCWLIKPCAEEDYLKCDAYTSSHIPCWESTVKGPMCMQDDCRICNVYQIVDRSDNIKELFKNFGELTNAGDALGASHN